jgi:hypothetical protein
MIFLFWRASNGAHTHDNGAIQCAFSPEHAGVNIVGLRQKMTELCRFEDVFKLPKFMSFDELKINYKLILSKISENGLRAHAKP